MTVTLFRIATDTPSYTADDLSGRGAELTGGRWNRPGSPVVYASTSIALACLETVVHLGGSGGLPLHRYLVKITVPDQVWSSRTKLLAQDLPVGWDAIPEGRISPDVGEKWIAAGVSALLHIPSVIVPEEANVLLNPKHPDAAAVIAEKIRKWTYDPRLWP